jgi:hypothetical protein
VARSAAGEPEISNRAPPDEFVRSHPKVPRGGLCALNESYGYQFSEMKLALVPHDAQREDDIRRR